MRTGRLSELVARRNVVQQAREILMREQAFSAEEANRYVYELARARKLMILEVADHIIAGKWISTEVSSEPATSDAAQWLGAW